MWTKRSQKGTPPAAVLEFRNPLHQCYGNYVIFVFIYIHQNSPCSIHRCGQVRGWSVNNECPCCCCCCCGVTQLATYCVVQYLSLERQTDRQTEPESDHSSVSSFVTNVVTFLRAQIIRGSSRKLHCTQVSNTLTCSSDTHSHSYIEQKHLYVRYQQFDVQK